MSCCGRAHLPCAAALTEIGCTCAISYAALRSNRVSPAFFKKWIFRDGEIDLKKSLTCSLGWLEYLLLFD